MTESASGKFSGKRADDYAVQSRIALAGYDACQQLGACILSAALPSGVPASILVVGAGGTGEDLLAVARLEQDWKFTAIDPSETMLAQAVRAYEREQMLHRITVVRGTVDDIDGARKFDGAILFGVLHHEHDDRLKIALLRGIASRLRQDAPLLVAGNRGDYRRNKLFMQAWQRRWVQGGEAGSARDRLEVILDGAAPPGTDEAMCQLLDDGGFRSPQLYFSSLFWGAWFVRKK